MKKTNKQKGITLVALVITIIESALSEGGILYGNSTCYAAYRKWYISSSMFVRQWFDFSSSIIYQVRYSINEK